MAGQGGAWCGLARRGEGFTPLTNSLKYDIIYKRRNKMENISGYAAKISNIPIDKKVDELKSVIKEMYAANSLGDKNEFENAFNKAFTIVVGLEADVKYIPDWYK